ncbi:hypothetical protein GO755_14220 [Spirosoma sp. HMF4905]|uniref:Uncharacterized protein n=1 Tax=Spirosoma arboris TaxID=2682092 RepID=A0A7K1SBJ5_9BACT|nr:hypothetical protein [Spirosoma arboris]MVM31194.1 hypothetical protein [Spirosoma arboris]
MLRIYLDKQVISYLRKFPTKKEDIYNQFLAIFQNQKDDFILPYSIGHFLDLKRDLTDIKDEDLTFMSSIGMNYFIRYNIHMKRSRIANENPLTAYYAGRLNENVNYQTRKESNVFDSINQEFAVMYKHYYKILHKINNNKNYKKYLSKQDIEFYERMRVIVPFDKRSISESKFIKYVQKYYYKLKEKPKSDLRAFMNERISKSKIDFTVPVHQLDFSKYNLKEDLENSNLQAFFIERILDLMVMKGEKDFNALDNVFFFHSFYQSLELTGIINEKPSKLSVESMTSDGEHAFSASYCDILITEDKKLSQKSKLLYGLLYINTLVFTVEEFIKYYRSYQKSVVIDKDQIIGLSKAEVKRFLANEIKKYNNLIERYYIDSEWRYLAMFNNINYNSVGGHYELIFSRITNNYLNMWINEEIRYITNLAVMSLGKDINGNSNFIEEVEIPQIQNKTWLGRIWHYDSLIIQLYISDSDVRHMLMRIGLFKQTSS